MGGTRTLVAATTAVWSVSLLGAPAQAAPAEPKPGVTLPTSAGQPGLLREADAVRPGRPAGCQCPVRPAEGHLRPGHRLHPARLHLEHQRALRRSRRGLDALVRVPAQKAQADAFVNWLLAPAADGTPHAMARRLGIMYIIWNNRMIRMYDPGRGWTDYRSCLSASNFGQWPGHQLPPQPRALLDVVGRRWAGHVLVERSRADPVVLLGALQLGQAGLRNAQGDRRRGEGRRSGPGSGHHDPGHPQRQGRRPDGQLSGPGWSVAVPARRRVRAGAGQRPMGCGPRHQRRATPPPGCRPGRLGAAARRASWSPRSVPRRPRCWSRSHRTGRSGWAPRSGRPT